VLVISMFILLMNIRRETSCWLLLHIPIELYWR
jgi:hypothetical protein